MLFCNVHLHIFYYSKKSRSSPRALFALGRLLKRRATTSSAAASARDLSSSSADAFCQVLAMEDVTPFLRAQSAAECVELARREAAFHGSDQVASYATHYMEVCHFELKVMQSRFCKVYICKTARLHNVIRLSIRFLGGI